MREPKEITINRILNYCKAHEACGDWGIYNKAKLILNKVNLTAQERQDIITQISKILFV